MTYFTFNFGLVDHTFPSIKNVLLLHLSKPLRLLAQLILPPWLFFSLNLFKYACVAFPNQVMPKILVVLFLASILVLKRDTS